MRFPWVALLAVLLLGCGIGSAAYGIYLLAGLGWALLSLSVPCCLFSVILLRGLAR